MAALTPDTVIADARQVDCVGVAVHGPEDPDLCGNHWLIYLVLPNNESIRVNIKIYDKNHLQGILEWSFKPYARSKKALECWEYEPAGKVSVGQIATLIYRLGRDKYEMSAEGSGCRYWVYTVIHDMVEQDYLKMNAEGMVYINYKYHNDKTKTPSAMVEGRFIPQRITSQGVTEADG